MSDDLEPCQVSDNLETCPVCGPEHQDLRREWNPEDPYLSRIICKACSAVGPSSHNYDVASLRWNVMAYNYKQEQEMKEVTRTSVSKEKVPDTVGCVTTISERVIGRTETVETGQESSVEISQNAKGHAQVSVKVYHADAEQAAIEAVALYRRTVAALASGGRV